MVAPAKPIQKVRWLKITKQQARKRFAHGDLIHLCPCKMAPGGVLSLTCLIESQDYLEKAKTYRSHPDLWKGTVEETAWSLMYNIWEYHNASWETGYYPHYYIQA